ncbi:hypothetical protein [Plastoroseomonas hellenica]|uniref:hypothetical protein n=1 Tax=Plastoroseomonas hellenica TaxID=2687306 RepID=UPI001BAB6117|nr:hypothetical protein [Plastoroseomonas hellenica]MBR0647564.1 hypothetical protein [Plastoroseomonas hellenica]
MSAPFRAIIRHWRGDLPLVVAFWVNGVLLGLVVLLAWRLAREPVERAMAAAGPATLRTALAGAMLAGILLLAWQLVGIWRAASAQIARGRISGWERSAQLTVLIGVFAAIDRYVDAVFAVAPLFSP